MTRTQRFEGDTVKQVLAFVAWSFLSVFLGYTLTPAPPRVESKWITFQDGTGRVKWALFDADVRGVTVVTDDPDRCPGAELLTSGERHYLAELRALRAQPSMPLNSFVVHANQPTLVTLVGGVGTGNGTGGEMKITAGPGGGDK